MKILFKLFETLSRNWLNITNIIDYLSDIVSLSGMEHNIVSPKIQIWIGRHNLTHKASRNFNKITSYVARKLIQNSDL